VELGDLELAVLRAVRTLGEASSGDIYEEVRKARDVAYTSVTTTLYRLVDKDLVTLRRKSEKRVYYRIKQGRAYKLAMSNMLDSVIDTFGGAAVSYLLANPERLPDGQIVALKEQAAAQRKKEQGNG
jgi:predicted transcriptional regulator